MQANEQDADLKGTRRMSYPLDLAVKLIPPLASGGGSRLVLSGTTSA